MQVRTTGLLLLGAMVLPATGTAQTTPAPPTITRTVIAATKLRTVTDAPVHFKAVSVTLQPDEKSSVSAANGILYQMSGSTGIALQRIDQIFVSHAHIDHFIGFDHLLRLLVGRETSVHLS